MIFSFSGSDQLQQSETELLTLTAVGHLQVLVSAVTGVSKHRVARSDGTAAFPVTAVDAG